jgi:YD repeat-containing protein
MDMNYITEEVLTKLGADKECKAWWIRNELDGFPVLKLKAIKGDCHGYIASLKEIFYNNTYDDNGNCLTFKDSKGYEQTYTYDENCNWLTYKTSDGYSLTYTYDEKGNLKSDNGDIYEYKQKRQRFDFDKKITKQF